MGARDRRQWKQLARDFEKRKRLQALPRNLIAQRGPSILDCPLGEAQAALPQKRGPRHGTVYPARRRGRHVAPDLDNPRVRHLPLGHPQRNFPRGAAPHAAHFSTWRPHPDASRTASERDLTD